MSDPRKHTHPGDGTVPGLHGEPIPTPVLGCPACATVDSIGDELGAVPEGPAPSLTDFLLARIAEDEDEARALSDPLPGARLWAYDEAGVIAVNAGRVLAECDAKRRIVEAESRWRRSVNGVSTETFRAPDETVAVTWMDEQGRPHQERVSQAEFRERFTEPSPPSGTLKFLALPYADHPEWREEWKP